MEMNKEDKEIYLFLRGGFAVKQEVLIMDTLDIMTYICEKREEFVLNGLNATDALAKATIAIAKEYHICSESINKLVIV